MSTGFGYNGFLGFATESSFGDGTASQKWVEIEDESIKGARTRIFKPTLRQVSVLNTVPSKKSVSGSFKYRFPLNGGEKLLYHALGTDTTTGTSPYTHAYTGANALPTGLAIHVNRDAANIGSGSAFVYKGCGIQKMTFTQSMEDQLMVSVDVVGQDWALENIETATYPTFAGLDYTMFALTFASASYVVKDFELTIENALATDRDQLGSGLIRGLGRNGPRKISGKFTKEFESKTEYNNFVNQTFGALSAVWTYDGSNSFTLACPKAVFQEAEPALSGQGPITHTFAFEARQNSAAGDELAATLINTTASGT